MVSKINTFTYLQVDHLPGLRRLGILARIQHGNLVFLDFLLQIAKFPFHLVTTANFIDEFALECVDIGI